MAKILKTAVGQNLARIDHIFSLCVSLNLRCRIKQISNYIVVFFYVPKYPSIPIDNRLISQNEIRLKQDAPIFLHEHA